jgi:hypothetical protein
MDDKPTPEQDAEVTGLTRPARVLLGWMPQMQGEMMLQGNTLGQKVGPEFCELARHARDAVQSRPAGFDQADLLSEPPDELDSHISQLRQTPTAEPMFREGWRVQIADLSRVCAFQPSVFTDGEAGRAESIKADDIAAIAAVTLPLEVPEPPRVQFDPARQAYMVLSPNQNLRIVGQFGTAVPNVPGATGLGFVVGVTQSFMQVVRFRDRFLLRDGYNRAFGLLRQGITHVPVFTRDLQHIEELGTSPGTLPQDAYLDERPPLLRDFHDDAVSRDVRLPTPQRMIVIQGIELSPGG